MKPIKLTMSAFGPYKDVVEVDFTKFGDNGIFLITGDTGAGKTTIFDGISYALFGESSGNNRSNNSLRSKFSLDTCETFVILEFMANNKIYKITRNPSYQVSKKRGEGMRQRPADAVLECENKIIESKLTNVNERINSILGINYKQFKQIAMLAQGEFLNVLFAESGEREKIFRKIFSTERLEMISNKLGLVQKEKKEKLEKLKVEFATNSNNIDTDNHQTISPNDITPEMISKIINELKEEIERKEKEKKTISKHITEKENQYKEKENQINNIESNNKKIENYEKLKKEQTELENKKEYIEIIKQQISIFDKVLKDVFPIENIIKDTTNNIHAINEKIIKLKSQISKNEKQLELISEKEKKVKDLEIYLDEYHQAINSKNNLTEDKKMLEETINIYKELDSYQSQYINIEQEYEEINQRHIKENDRYFRNQASIIAESLEDNKPCPVCGSLSHPNIAKIEDKVLSKQEIDKLKKDVENKFTELNKIKEKITFINSKIEIFLNKLNCKTRKEIEEQNEKNSKFIAEIDAKLEKVINNFNNIYFFLSNKTIAIEDFQMVSFLTEFHENNSLIKENISNDKTLLEEQNSQLIEIDNKEKELQNQLLKKLQEIGFKNYEDYQENDISKQKYEMNVNTIEKYKEDITSVKAQLSILEQELQNIEFIDLTEEKEELIIINNELSELKETFQNNVSSLNNNIKIKDKLEITSKDLIEHMNIYSVYESLYKLANGNIAGKRRVSFEQYVQATYFDMVLEEANKRFNIMTDGRFSLFRKIDGDNSLSSKFALDLDVYDEYTGTKRDVRSLSGGESFKASLSLALGLSDVIQNFSGGIKIDALFIDEGFGSLDDESREQAINILNSLSGNNKLIGIISHVSELKDRIDKKIIVTKNKEGSTILLEA